MRNDVYIHEVHPAVPAPGSSTRGVAREVARVSGLLLVLALVGCGGETPAANADRPLAVIPHTVTAETGYRLARTFTGRIEALQSVSLGFEVGGRIQALRADAGDRIEAGTVLAELDAARLQARRDEIAANRDEVLAERALARRTLERTRTAFEAGAVEPQALDEAERGVRTLTARAAALAAALQSVEADLEDSVLRAPIDALVIARHQDLGAVVAAATPVFDLVQPRPLEARIALPADAAAQLSADQSHEVSVEGRVFPAQLRAIIPVRDPRTRTVDVLLRLDAELGSTLRTDDITRMTVERQVSAPGHWLPRTALTEGTRGLWAVYRIVETEAGTRVERAEVEVLHTNGERAYVTGSLSAGDRVVARGLHRLTPGLLVRVQDPETDDA